MFLEMRYKTIADNMESFEAAKVGRSPISSGLAKGMGMGLMNGRDPSLLNSMHLHSHYSLTPNNQLISLPLHLYLLFSSNQPGLFLPLSKFNVFFVIWGP
eukprot:TRINITY_DN4696_c0_g2_i1.p1 TRINITY_DN4696_c0_g2~~TRINITY_DN4696_c0_g2_i1.p1  ORF type:complete len:100 (-),score=14.69 TRINITY_DN4696_c0_g2_i1:854-1153(-)